MRVSILMPCLNEAETIEECIRKAQRYLAANNIDGEIVIADNGSTDNSVYLAENSMQGLSGVKRKDMERHLNMEYHSARENT